MEILGKALRTRPEKGKRGKRGKRARQPEKGKDVMVCVRSTHPKGQTQQLVKINLDR